jgi:hypothetical protein
MTSSGFHTLQGHYQKLSDLGNTSWAPLSGAPLESSAPLPDIPEEGNTEALPLIFALEQHALTSGKFGPLARMLLALHGGKTRPQEDGMLPILGVQPVDAVIDAAYSLGLQHFPEEIELGVTLAAQV